MDEERAVPIRRSSPGSGQLGAVLVKEGAILGKKGAVLGEEEAVPE